MFIGNYTNSVVAPSLTALTASYNQIMLGNVEDMEAVFNSADVLTYYTNFTSYVQMGPCANANVQSSVFRIAANSTVPCVSVYSA
jgi:hypothetical protein